MIPDAALEHFKFSRDPFGEPWEDADVWNHPQAAAVEAQVREALMKGELLLVKGPSGSGKTVLARTALSRLLGQARSPRLAGRSFTLARLLTLRRREATGTSLVRALYRDFARGQEVPRNSEDMVAGIARAIAQRYRDNENFGVILEEAHELSMATLLDLKKLREIVGDYGGALAAILIGQTETEPDIDSLLADARVVAIQRRLFALEIQGLSRPKARDYVSFRLGRAGARADALAADALGYLLEALWPEGRSGPSRLYPAEIDVRLSQAFVAAWEKGARSVDKRLMAFALNRGGAGTEDASAEVGTRSAE